jgi:hypothetical protein
MINESTVAQNVNRFQAIVAFVCQIGVFIFSAVKKKLKDLNLQS